MNHSERDAEYMDKHGIRDPPPQPPLVDLKCFRDKNDADKTVQKIHKNFHSTENRENRDEDRWQQGVQPHRIEGAVNLVQEDCLVNENGDIWAPLMSDGQLMSPLQRMMEATPDSSMQSPIVPFSSSSDDYFESSSPRKIPVMKNRQGSHLRQHYSSTSAQLNSQPSLAHATQKTLMGLVDNSQVGSGQTMRSSPSARKGNSMRTKSPQQQQMVDGNNRSQVGSGQTMRSSPNAWKGSSMRNKSPLQQEIVDGNNRMMKTVPLHDPTTSNMTLDQQISKRRNSPSFEQPPPPQPHVSPLMTLGHPTNKKQAAYYYPSRQQYSSEAASEPNPWISGFEPVVGGEPVNQWSDTRSSLSYTGGVSNHNNIPRHGSKQHHQSMALQYPQRPSQLQQSATPAQQHHVLPTQQQQHPPISTNVKRKRFNDDDFARIISHMAHAAVSQKIAMTRENMRSVLIKTGIEIAEGIENSGPLKLAAEDHPPPPPPPSQPNAHASPKVKSTLFDSMTNDNEASTKPNEGEMSRESDSEEDQKHSPEEEKIKRKKPRVKQSYVKEQDLIEQVQTLKNEHYQLELMNKSLKLLLQMHRGGGMAAITDGTQAGILNHEVMSTGSTNRI